MNLMKVLFIGGTILTAAVFAMKKLFQRITFFDLCVFIFICGTIYVLGAAMSAWLGGIRQDG